MDESERLIAVAALATGQRAQEAWATWRRTVPQGDAPALLSWAGGYIHRNLRRAGIEEPYLAGIARHNFLTNSRRIFAVLPTIRTLTQRFRVTPLKSFGLSEEIHARSLRPLADLDFFVPPLEVDGARATLADAGYRPLLDLGDDEFRRRTVPHRGSWNYLDGKGGDLDLHWRLFDHLELDENAAVVAAHSDLVESEFGPIHRLRPELMLIALSTHYLSSPGHLKGLFDVDALVRSVDPGDVARLTLELRLEREMGQIADALIDLVGQDAAPEVFALRGHLEPARSTRPSFVHTEHLNRRALRTPDRFFDAEAYRHPGVAKLWDRLGRPARLERLFIRALGPLTAPTTADAVLPVGGGALGAGWLHRYPGDPHRWATLPDARVLWVAATGARAVRLELSENWVVSPLPALQVFANGRLIGTIDRGRSSYRLPLQRPARGALEVSIRPASWSRYVDPGIHLRWYRMIAPVRSIELDFG